MVSNMSEGNNEGHDAGAGDVMEPPHKKPRCAKAIDIETTSLSILISSYNNHFSTYSATKKNVTQLVPGAVWKKVYQDYINHWKAVAESRKEKFDMGTVNAEETLKKQLRQGLKSIETGRSDGGDGKAVLQDESVLQRLKETDDHRRRLMCKARNNIIETGSVSGTPSSEADACSQPPGKQQPLSKTQMMAKSLQALDVIADTMASTGNAMTEVMKDELEQSSARTKVSQDRLELDAKRHNIRIKLDTKKVELEEKRSELDAKRFLLQERKSDMEAKTAKLEQLRFLKENGVLTQEEFSQRALDLVNM